MSTEITFIISPSGKKGVYTEWCGEQFHQIDSYIVIKCGTFSNYEDFPAQGKPKWVVDAYVELENISGIDLDVSYKLSLYLITENGKQILINNLDYENALFSPSVKDGRHCGQLGVITVDNKLAYAEIPIHHYEIVITELKIRTCSVNLIQTVEND